MEAIKAYILQIEITSLDSVSPLIAIDSINNDQRLQTIKHIRINSCEATTEYLMKDKRRVVQVEGIEQAIQMLKHLKDNAVKDQKYDIAKEIMDIERLLKVKTHYTSEEE